jgi:hypothetical protein
MAKCYKIGNLLSLLKGLDEKGRIESVVPTSVKSVSFNDMEGHTYVGIFKVSYKGTERYRLFKVVFNSSDLDYEYDAMDYMHECLVSFGFA